MTHPIRTLTLILALAGTSAVLGACRTNAQTGALIGSGVGAGAGYLVGENNGSGSTGAAIGAAVGGGAGYMIGNEQDKADAEREREQNRRDGSY